MFDKKLEGTPFIYKAMLQLIPKGNIYTLRGNDWSGIEWDANNTDACPTEAEVATLAEELRVADIYRNPRKKAYPSIGEQLDMQYHDQLDGTTTWKDAVAKVKSDNPKNNTGPVE